MYVNYKVKIPGYVLSCQLHFLLTVWSRNLKLGSYLISRLSVLQASTLTSRSLCPT